MSTNAFNKYAGVALGAVMAISGSAAQAADNQPQNVEHFTTKITDPSVTKLKYSYLFDHGNLVTGNTVCGPRAVTVHSGVKNNQHYTRFDLTPIPDAFRKSGTEADAKVGEAGSADVDFKGGKLVYEYDAHSLSAKWLNVIPKNTDVVMINFTNAPDCQHSGTTTTTPPDNGGGTPPSGGCNGNSNCGGNGGGTPVVNNPNNGGNTPPGPNGGAGANPPSP